MITVKIGVQSNLETVWDCWTRSEHITNWNFASDDWCCPKAENDLRPNGEFSWRMEERNGGIGFDFTGTYDQVIPRELITYKMSDGRKVKIVFAQGDEGEIVVSESFEAEGTNSDEMQRAGWQAILGNFKKYVESN